MLLTWYDSRKIGCWKWKKLQKKFFIGLRVKWIKLERRKKKSDKVLRIEKARQTAEKELFTLNVESSEIFSHINQATFTSRFQGSAICMSIILRHAREQRFVREQVNEKFENLWNFSLVIFLFSVFVNVW